MLIGEYGMPVIVAISEHTTSKVKVQCHDLVLIGFCHDKYFICLDPEER